MKEIKFILRQVPPALYVSLWWLAGVVQAARDPGTGKEAIWALPGIATLWIVIGAIAYLYGHWNE